MRSIIVVVDSLMHELLSTRSINLIRKIISNQSFEHETGRDVELFITIIPIIIFPHEKHS